MDKWFINLKWLLYRNNLSSLIAITGIVSPPRLEEGDCVPPEQVCMNFANFNQISAANH